MTLRAGEDFSLNFTENLQDGSLHNYFMGLKFHSSGSAEHYLMFNMVLCHNNYSSGVGHFLKESKRLLVQSIVRTNSVNRFYFVEGGDVGGCENYISLHKFTS